MEIEYNHNQIRQAFVEGMKLADKNMVERVRNKLQEGVYDKYFEMHEDFIDAFCKELMEE